MRFASWLGIAAATLSLADALGASAQTAGEGYYWPHGAESDLPPTLVGPAAVRAPSGPALRLDLGPFDRSAGWRAPYAGPYSSDGRLGALSLGAGGAIVAPNGTSLLIGRYGPTDPTVDILGHTFTRAWPSVVRVKTGTFGFDVSPHAGLGVSDSGQAQNAGAVLRFGRGLGEAAGSGARRGVWYLFASAERETLGYNFMRGEDAWKRAGFASDPGAQIGDTRAGVAWSRGPVEASFGYLYREVKPKDVNFDAQTTKESMVSLKVSYRPAW